jgi:hypothetical protein
MQLLNVVKLKVEIGGPIENTKISVTNRTKRGILVELSRTNAIWSRYQKKKKTDRTKHMKHPQTIINLSEVGNLSELQ